MTQPDAPSPAAQGPTRFLDPATLESGYTSMFIRARDLVDGILNGLHRSPHKGGSVEFAEYKEYTPGQDPKHIDWKIFAKSDKVVVKQFEDETNLRVYLILDGSGSMDYQSEDAPLSKLRHVSFLAASLAYLFLNQGDAIGALGFDDTVRHFLPASTKSSHLDDLFYMLDQLQSRRPTHLKAALQTISERAKNRALLLIFSDFLDLDEDTLNQLRVLRSRQYEVALFHVLDPAEVDFPFEGLTLFEGLEGEDGVMAEPDDVRARYMALMQMHLERIKHQCDTHDLEYTRFLTHEPIEAVALRFLSPRLAR